MPALHPPTTLPAAPAAGPLPPGMRATRATRALQALYAARPDEALSEPEVEAALAAAGVQVNKVTVYRLLDRFAAAGLLHRQVDAARVARYALAPLQGEGATPRFECDDCHRHFRLSQGSAKVQTALKHVLDALATAGHESLAVDIAVRGRCAGCAHPAEGAAA
jgi:Fur family transcriptional regulator, ferric uptake regulator